MDRLLNWLLDLYAWFRGNSPSQDLVAVTPPRPGGGHVPPAIPSKTFIIVGDFVKAWQSGKANGKINGLPCTINYKAGVVTITLKETA
jgi:hypothetical protein